MATNVTNNLLLSQWIEDDLVLMADFNADNLKIDNAFKSICEDMDALQTVVDSMSGNSSDDNATGAVRYDEAQSLTDNEQLQARNNIGAAADLQVGLLVTTVQNLKEDVDELQTNMGSGSDVLVLDLTGSVRVDSDSSDAQSFDLSIDADAVMAHDGLVALDYTDVRFDGTQRIWLTSRRSNPDGADSVFALFGVAANQWTETPSVFKLTIFANGSVTLVYRPTVDGSGGAGEPLITGIDTTNMTEDFNGGSVVYTLDDGSTITYTQGTDADGNYTLTSGSHVITLKGLS